MFSRRNRSDTATSAAASQTSAVPSQAGGDGGGGVSVHSSPAASRASGLSFRLRRARPAGGTDGASVHSSFRHDTSGVAGSVATGDDGGSIGSADEDGKTQHSVANDGAAAGGISLAGLFTDEEFALLEQLDAEAGLTRTATSSRFPGAYLVRDPKGGVAEVKDDGGSSAVATGPTAGSGLPTPEELAKQAAAAAAVNVPAPPSKLGKADIAGAKALPPPTAAEKAAAASLPPVTLTDKAGGPQPGETAVSASIDGAQVSVPPSVVEHRRASLPTPALGPEEIDAVRARFNVHAHCIQVCNTEFQGLPPLQSVVGKRSQTLHEVLTDPLLCGFDPQRVHRLVNADRAAVEAAFVTVAKAATQNSTVLIIITSRGYRIRRGLHRGSYIMTSDAPWEGETRDLVEASISVRHLAGWIQMLPTTQVLIVLDVAHLAENDIILQSFFSERALRVRTDFPQLVHEKCRGAVIVAPLVLTTHVVGAVPSTPEDLLLDTLNAFTGGAGIRPDFPAAFSASDYVEWLDRVAKVRLEAHKKRLERVVKLAPLDPKAAQVARGQLMVLGLVLSPGVKEQASRKKDRQHLGPAFAYGDLTRVPLLGLRPKPPPKALAPIKNASSRVSITLKWIMKPYPGHPVQYAEVQVRGVGRASREWLTVSLAYRPVPILWHSYTHIPRFADREGPDWAFREPPPPPVIAEPPTGVQAGATDTAAAETTMAEDKPADSAAADSGKAEEKSAKAESASSSSSDSDSDSDDSDNDAKSRVSEAKSEAKSEANKGGDAKPATASAQPAKAPKKAKPKKAKAVPMMPVEPDVWNFLPQWLRESCADGQLLIRQLPELKTVFRVRDRIADTSYEFRIRYLNHGGFGPWSNVSQPLFTTQVKLVPITERVQIATKEGVDAVVHLLAKEPLLTELCARCCKILASMCRVRRDQAIAYREGAVPAILAAMRNAPSSVDLASAGTFALGMLLASNGPLLNADAALLKEVLEMAKAAATRHKYDVAVRNNVAWVLQLLHGRV